VTSRTTPPWGQAGTSSCPFAEPERCRETKGYRPKIDRAAARGNPNLVPEPHEPAAHGPTLPKRNTLPFRDILT
jgi:hypothetical protein